MVNLLPYKNSYLSFSIKRHCYLFIPYLCCNYFYYYYYWMVTMASLKLYIFKRKKKKKNHLNDLWLWNRRMKNVLSVFYFKALWQHMYWHTKTLLVYKVWRKNYKKKKTKKKKKKYAMVSMLNWVINKDYPKF